MSGSSYGYGDHVGYLPGLNDTMICPYNTAHVVGVTRMQRHLNNCRLQNPDKAAQISICPYNRSHHIPKTDLSAHLVVCRDYLSHKFQSVMRVNSTLRHTTQDEFFDDGPESSSAPAPPGNEDPQHGQDCDIDDGASDTSTLTGVSEAHSSDDVFGPPRARRHVPRSDMYMKEVDGVMWTAYKGEGYQAPFDSKGNKLKHHNTLPKLNLPPCDQEEIDNWV